MPKLDGLKADLEIIKFWLGIVVASFIAIIGWLASNYKTADDILIISALISLVFLLLAIFVFARGMKNKAKEIKDCKK